MISPILFFLLFLLFSFFLSCSYALTQDFCVADKLAPKGPAGYPCKDADEITIDDFTHCGLGGPANTSNPSKFGLIPAYVTDFPGINGLGISIARIDIGAGGIGPVHSHPGATELVLLAEGDSVTAGFIDSNNKAYHKALKAGEAMVFPRGLYHFIINQGKSPAVIYASYTSESPTTQLMDMALFKNDLATDIVAKITMLDVAQVKKLKSTLGGTN